MTEQGDPPTLFAVGVDHVAFVHQLLFRKDVLFGKVEWQHDLRQRNERIVGDCVVEFDGIRLFIRNVGRNLLAVEDGRHGLVVCTCRQFVIFGTSLEFEHRRPERFDTELVHTSGVLGPLVEHPVADLRTALDNGSPG